MTFNEIRAKAQHLDTNTRRWNIVSGASFLLLTAGDAWQVWAHQEILLRAVGDTFSPLCLGWV